MTERLNDRDWRLISAYLDAQLSPVETERVEKRIKEDLLFNRSLDEIAYTKRLLSALPQKRAPRNFTLASEKAQKPLRALWLQPALSFVSIAATALLVVVFSFNYLGAGSARQAAAPQSEMLAAEAPAAEGTEPVIINWNPVLGMGGGGGAADAKEVYTGGDGIGGAGGPGFPVAEPGVGGGESLGPLEPDPETVAQPAPIAREEDSAAVSDLSTLILGLPDEETAGTVIQSTPLREEPASLPRRGLSSPILIMIIAGATAILAGAAALILRKITHA